MLASMEEEVESQLTGCACSIYFYQQAKRHCSTAGILSLDVFLSFGLLPVSRTTNYAVFSTPPSLGPRFSDLLFSFKDSLLGDCSFCSCHPFTYGMLHFTNFLHLFGYVFHFS